MNDHATQFLYLYKYFFGATTFTAHLIHKLRKEKARVILRAGNSQRSEKRLREFGYGLFSQNVSSDIISQNIL